MKKLLQLVLFLIIAANFLSKNTLPCSAQTASEQSKPVYAVIQNKLFELSETIRPVGVFPCAVNQRAFGVLYTAHSSQFLYWDSGKLKLIVTDQKLRPIKELAMLASSVWIHANMILAVSRNWENGFTFSLYNFQNNNSLSELASWKLDLFISDCIVTAHGVLLAGGSKDDRFNYVYWCVPGKTPQLLAKTTKEKSFLKIINADTGAYVYESAQTKTTHRLDILFFPYEKNTYKPPITLTLKQSNLPACWYGSGFYFDNNLYVPAYNGKEIVLTRIQHKKTELEIVKIYDNAYGVYSSLGLYKNKYWFVGYDYYSNPAKWSLSYFDIEKKLIVHNFFKF